MTAATPDSDAAAATPARWRRCVAGLERPLLVIVVLAAAAPWLRLDVVAPGMIFTYAPRPVAALAAALLAAAGARRRRWRRALAMSVAAALLVAAMGWGGGGHASATAGDRALTLLAFNVLDDVGVRNDLPGLCERQGVDILALQEVRAPQRAALAAAMPRFRFFHNVDLVTLGYPEHLASSTLIGVRRDVLEDENDVELAPAITGYRSFAVRVRVRGRHLWVASVHFTKPIWRSRHPWKTITRAASKAGWHRRERDRLAKWVGARRDEPVIVAGDFNAPDASYGLRFDGLRSAHAEAGRGPHLTWPAALPLYGLDHVLGNDRVRFLRYETVWRGYSDHAAQICRFAVD